MDSGGENVALAFLTSSQRFVHATALRGPAGTITHGELDAAVARAAELLRSLGVVPGDRVGLILPNVPQFAVLYYAVLQVGAIAVPISSLLSRAEVEFCLGDAQAGLAFYWDAQEITPMSGVQSLQITPSSFLGSAAVEQAPIAQRDGDDTAVIIYTSGTTGQPKGAQLTHRNLARNAAAILASTPIGAETVALGALPLSHSFGQTWLLNATLAAGGSVSVVTRFTADDAVATIARDRVTFFAGVPTMFAQLLDAPGLEINTLNLCVSGGAPMPPDLMREFETRFGCEVREGYGLSETSPLTTLNPAGEARRPGSVGTPIPGVHLRISDNEGDEVSAEEVGEVLVRGHNVMKGYWARPRATEETITADGWLRTGDIGYLDGDGYLFIVGRKKDLVIRGGFNVYPREVEDALCEHAAVAEAAVIGVSHPALGEEVAAAVRLHEGVTCSTEELTAHAKRRLAAYKYPRILWTVDRLPTGPTGKVVKRLIEIPLAPGSSGHAEPSGQPTPA